MFAVGDHVRVLFDDREICTPEDQWYLREGTISERQNMGGFWVLLDGITTELPFFADELEKVEV
jgi:hypothetical protein